ncbi:hypothetical protein PO148_07215 [Limosilactobacillus mucosae]|uniref:XkdX family protein n=1 Tax=Limosilactobacillus mucosae TaxID=97478 RepID=A0AAJ1HUF2_LIMMU|nr:hypothetical protein [Limosilactobacillus mucosae]MDC2830178.1 hypothetical protein [Limosilactobacillus mucosae]MDC2837749.1 hypothetical protein [Limosilactobacillus mucosae]MDC2849766.1 hypothetical protein [Limosilactobacillus mucosae]MDC2853902.1 hypothetical protein [Limosilactobacillus mucosae]
MNYNDRLRFREDNLFLFFPIDCYAVYHTITVEQYRKITGKDYVAASDLGSANAAQSANTAVSQA